MRNTTLSGEIHSPRRSTECQIWSKKGSSIIFKFSSNPLFKRRKNKQAKVESDDKVSIQAPLDPAVFEQMDEDETVSQIQQQSMLPSYLTKMP